MTTLKKMFSIVKHVKHLTTSLFGIQKMSEYYNSFSYTKHAQTINIYITSKRTIHVRYPNQFSKKASDEKRYIKDNFEQTTMVNNMLSKWIS